MFAFAPLYRGGVPRIVRSALSLSDKVMESKRPPEVESKTVVALLTKLYPFKHVSVDSLKPLPSYDDRNIYFEGVRETTNGSSDRKEPFIFKMSNYGIFTPEIVEGLNSMLLFLSRKGFPCCRPLASRSGQYALLATEKELLGVADENEAISSAGVKYPVRVLKYIPGEVMDKLEKRFFTPDLSYSVGSLVGRMDLALQDFQHPAIDERVMEVWDMQHFTDIKDYIPHIQDEKKREIADTVMAMFEANILPAMQSWKKGVIHGDANGLNIILEKVGEGHKIVGLIDFGDCVRSYYLFELGITLAYAMIEKDNPVEFVVPMLRGYLDALPLSKDELGCLYYAVLARLCQSAVMGEYQFTLEPWNTYLLTTPAEAWRLMDLLLTLSKDRVETIWGVWK